MAVFTRWWLIVCSVIKIYIIGFLSVLRQALAGHRYAKDSELPRQDGKVVIITGGGAGIGKHVTKRLAMLGAHVIIAGKCKEEAESVIKEIQGEAPFAKVEEMFLDLRSLDSVKKFVENFQKKGLPLHILINNAAVMLVPFNMTVDNFEEHMATNFLAPVLLTCLLLPKLQKSSQPDNSSRVINVASVVHHLGDFNTVDAQGKDVTSSLWNGSGDYSSHAQYPKSKLALVLFTRWLQRHLESTNSTVTANAVDPGVVNTGLHDYVNFIMRPFIKLLMKSPMKGACTTVFAATTPSLEGLGGLYLDNCQPTKSSQLSYDRQLQDSLCQKVTELLGLEWK